MCSHSLASQLYITATDLPEFYLKYCLELKAWSEYEWPTKSRLTVEDAEYALWTWYRIAYKSEDPKQRNKARREFRRDSWVQKRREMRVAESLNWGRRLDLARAYVNSDPTVAAIIAWREFEVALVSKGIGIEKTRGDGTRLSIGERIRKLPPDKIPPGWNAHTLTKIWCDGTIGRNDVMHYDRDPSPVEAIRIVNGVDAFIMHNFPEV